MLIYVHKTQIYAHKIYIYEHKTLNCALNFFNYSFVSKNTNKMLTCECKILIYAHKLLKWREHFLVFLRMSCPGLHSVTMWEFRINGVLCENVKIILSRPAELITNLASSQYQPVKFTYCKRWQNMESMVSLNG